jgi:alkylation response protein AidB-like acyl-CoA dehydrogenase
LYLPADLGGLGADLPAACEVIAELSAADAAAGWALMIGAGPNWFAGSMPAPLAEEVFGRSDGLVAGSGTPGRARPVAGGHRVSGRWRWCSGAPWVGWFTFAVEAGEGAAVVAVPAGDVELDPGSWQVRGLAATASLDVALPEVFVPAERLFRVDEAAPQRDEPIFRVPFRSFAETTMAAVAVGLSRHLLDEFAALARAKTPMLAGDRLAAQPLTRDRFARATALVRAARVAWAGQVTRLWAAVLAAPAGATLDPGLLADVQLASVHATSCAAAAADLLRPLTGMSTLPQGSQLGQVLADAHAVGHNMVLAEARFADSGAVLLGPEG